MVAHCSVVKFGVAYFQISQQKMIALYLFEENKKISVC